MPTERLVLNSRAFAAALAVSASMCSAGALAQAAGTASGLSDGKPANTPITGSTSRDVGGVVGEARDLYKQGKLIHARALLDELVRTNKIHDLSDEEQSAGLSLLREIDVKVRTSDPVEVSLQRAEYFLSIGELRQAERHANAVAARGNLTPTQEERAEKALGDIQARRNELTPLVPGLIEQAQADFAAERYASAKGAVLTVLRSGVELTAQQVQELEGYQLKILDIENSRGTAFNVAGEAGLASMQPGTVRKGNEPAGEPTPPPPEPEQPSEGVTLTGADVQEQPASPAPEPAVSMPAVPATPSGWFCMSMLHAAVAAANTQPMACARAWLARDSRILGSFREKPVDAPLRWFRNHRGAAFGPPDPRPPDNEVARGGSEVPVPGGSPRAVGWATRRAGRAGGLGAPRDC